MWDWVSNILVTRLVGSCLGVRVVDRDTAPRLARRVEGDTRADGMHGEGGREGKTRSGTWSSLKEARVGDCIWRKMGER